MKTIVFLNIKGGVGKTVSSINFAYILANDYNKKVLLVDLDKQANASKSMNCYDNAEYSVADLLVNKNLDVNATIIPSKYPNIDVIPASMELFKANQTVLLDVTTPQQTRLKKHFSHITKEYDYCIFDCPTDINIGTLNALVITDDVLIPVKFDAYSLEGIEYVLDAIENMQDFNPSLSLSGCFVTMFQNNTINKQGMEYLHSLPQLNAYNSYIRHTVKVLESTFDAPVAKYSENSTAAKDYRALVAEYLERSGK